MAIVTKVVKKLDIPHEDGEHMELRRLSWRQLEQAQEVATEELYERIKKMGPEVIASFQKSGNQQQQEAVPNYDRSTVLKLGIAGWSYDAEVTPENIDCLDEQTAAWAYDEIMAMSKPRPEEERKNG